MTCVSRQLISQQFAAALALVGCLIATQVGSQQGDDVDNRVAQVSNSQQFSAAFLDNGVTTIVLVPASAQQDYGDLLLDAQAWPFSVDHPCTITRNLTITSNPTPAILDWGFAQGKCVLGPGVKLTLRGIVTANSRFGSGFNFDLFLLSNGAVVEVVDSVRWQVACAPQFSSLATLKSLPRPAGFPGGVQQAATLPALTVRGTVYTVSTIFLQDVAVQSAVSLDSPQDGGGYVVALRNTSRVCQRALNPVCVQANGAEACIREATRQEMARQGRPTPDSFLTSASGSGGSDDGVPVAAIAVPVVMGTVVIAAAALAIILRRRRRRRSRRSGTTAVDSDGSTQQQSPPSEVWRRALAAPQATDGWVLIAQRTLPGLASPAGGHDIAVGVLLGTGSYGKVYKGRWLERDVAVKVVLHSRLTAQHVARECEIIMGLRHPNIVRAFQFLTWYKPRPASNNEDGHHGRSSGNSVPASSSGQGFSSAAGGSGGVDAPPRRQGAMHSPHNSSDASGDDFDAQTWIVTEYCSEGNCCDAAGCGNLTLFDGRATLLPLLCRLLEVAAGMAHLHAHNILHGDLKGSNVLLASSPSAPFGTVAKLSDFGLSRSLAEGRTHRSTRSLGTVTHMSPEQLRRGKMSTAGDVYAYGIMAWELLTGRVAFGGMHYGQVVERVVLHWERPEMPEDVPADLAALVEACWEHDAQRRPSFAAVAEAVAAILETQIEAARQAGDHELVEAAARPLVTTGASSTASIGGAGHSAGNSGAGGAGAAGSVSGLQLLPMHVGAQLGSRGSGVESSSHLLGPQTPVPSRSSQPQDL